MKKSLIHIIGIGGIGMSAIAEILKKNNYKVQGSDEQSNDNVNRLKSLGIEIYIGHNANNIENAQIVVYSSAIKPDNAELSAAKDSNKIILHRSEILAEILKDKYVIAVSGSSGKTTTTAMIASIFDYSSKFLPAIPALLYEQKPVAHETVSSQCVTLGSSRPLPVNNSYIFHESANQKESKCTVDSSVTHLDDTNMGIDATVIVGGILNSYQSNAKLGRGNIFLIEADESDGTMLKIPANIAVITSINDDHIDYYGTFDDIKSAFSQFINKAECAILPDSIDVNCSAESITFGFGDKDVRAINIQQYSSNMKFDVLISSTLLSSHHPLSSQCVTLGSRSAQIASSSLSSQCVTLESRSAQIASPSLSSQCVTLGSRSAQIASSSLSSQCVTLGSRIIKDVILSNAVGLHKVSNALAAISVAVRLGINEEDIRKGLLEFKGVARRFSLIAEINGVKLIEDYAHHPTEIQATLTSARSITNRKVIGIIEPLRFARIRNFFNEFIKIFMKFDYVILTPVHPPEDKPIPGYDISDIEKALISNGFDNVKIMNDSLSISHFISSFTNSGDIALFIGAGSNIARLAKETAEFMK